MVKFLKFVQTIHTDPPSTSTPRKQTIILQLIIQSNIGLSFTDTAF